MTDYRVAIPLLATAPLPEMPNAHDPCAHLAGAYRIRTSQVRLLQMRSRRTNCYSARSNEVWLCWLVRWRTTAADVRSCLRLTLPRSPDRKHLIALFRWSRHSLSSQSSSLPDTDLMFQSCVSVEKWCWRSQSLFEREPGVQHDRQLYGRNLAPTQQDASGLRAPG